MSEWEKEGWKGGERKRWKVIEREGWRKEESREMDEGIKRGMD